MKDKRSVSIQMRIAMTFILILLLSCVISFFTVVPFISTYVSGNVESQLVNTVTSLVMLSKRSTLSLGEIITFNNSDLVELSVHDDYYEAGFYLSKSEIEALEDGEAVYRISMSGNRSVAIVKIDGSYIVAEGVTAADDMLMARMILLFQTAVCLVSGIFLMVIIVGRITRPLNQLSYAAREVAGGNFNVTVQCDGNDEIAALAKNFNLMTGEIQKMELMRKDFISNVSHEFKTPISSIQGFARLLRSDNLPPEKAKEYAAVIEEEASRLGNLTTNILRLSRLENQTIPRRPALFSLDEQIRKTIVLLESQWSEKNIDFDLNLEKISFLGDEEIIQQIWINIIGNAIKFTGNGGLITVLLAAVGDDIIIQIADNGIGIPKDKQARVFEQFYQADPSRNNKGNGLGLTIVKKIVDSCHGTITFESAVGKGTKFIITLPKKQI